MKIEGLTEIFVSFTPLDQVIAEAEQTEAWVEEMLGDDGDE